MTKFINNVNKYLSEMKIKQTYLSMITGIDKNKISRILTGAQEESGTDMEKIARGLGKTVEFFGQTQSISRTWELYQRIKLRSMPENHLKSRNKLLIS